MKISLASFAILALFSTAVLAQTSSESMPSGDKKPHLNRDVRKNMMQKKQDLRNEKSSGESSANENTAPEESANLKDGKGKWQERYKNASPEKKAKMENRKAIMEKLSPEQKEAVKKEIERHRQEMKKYGFSGEGSSDLQEKSSN